MIHNTEESKNKNFWEFFHLQNDITDITTKFENKTFSITEGLIPNKFEISNIPLGGPVTGKFKISNDNIRAGAGVGNSLAYAGGFIDYDFKSGLGVGAEVSVIENISAEAIARYNWDEDKINIKVSAEIFDLKVDLVDWDVHDVAQNTIGKGIDSIRNGVDDFIKHVSPEERAKQRAIEEIRNDANNVRDIHGLRNVIDKIGENEVLKKGNEVMYEAHRAQLEYLTVLDNQVNQNTIDIQRHELILQKHEDRLNKHDEILANHENRLNRHEKILSVHAAILSNHEKRLNRHEMILNNHENRLNRHEKILSVHAAILSNHEKRLNRHEYILNIHENRLNEHDRILSFHSSILRDHEEKLNIHASAINHLYNIANQHNQILNLHGKKLYELDERMFNAENNISILGKEVDVHAKILANHDEILKIHGESICELYDITNKQQIQLNIHNDIINDHQKEIVKLIYNYNDLKKRIENDEKIINNLGAEVAKVVNFSVETRNIVDGLSYQTQIHKDLIVQNHNDVVNIYKELENQADYIIAHGTFLKEIANEVYYQREILQQHEKKILELQKFVQNLAKDVKNIFGILNNFDERLSKVEKEIENIRIANKLDNIKNNIDNRVERLIDKIDRFNDDQLIDFIKCVYICLGNGTYNLLKVEEIVKNILILKI